MHQDSMCPVSEGVRSRRSAPLRRPALPGRAAPGNNAARPIGRSRSVRPHCHRVERAGVGQLRGAGGGRRWRRRLGLCRNLRLDSRRPRGSVVPFSGIRCGWPDAVRCDRLVHQAQRVARTSPPGAGSPCLRARSPGVYQLRVEVVNRLTGEQGSKTIEFTVSAASPPPAAARQIHRHRPPRRRRSGAAWTSCPWTFESSIARASLSPT